jgi:regulator of RNase E activity RraB
LKYTFVIKGVDNYDPIMYDNIDSAKRALRETITDLMDDGNDNLEAYILEAVEQHDVEVVTKPDIKITFLKD